MSDDNLMVSQLSKLFGTLKPKTKIPNSANILNNWIAKAEGDLGEPARAGRLGWLIASSVAIAAVQRAIDTQGNQLFLLKGGNLLQHRLPGSTRTTKDVDGLVRGDLDSFFEALEDALVEPWGPIRLRRGPVELVNVPTKIIKPRRFDIILDLQGVTWRRIKFEASPDEASIAAEPEPIQPPTLAGFGLPDPDELVGIAIRFQIAQKFHASSDPHNPPEEINDRARDVVDLLLLRELTNEVGHPTLGELRHATEAVFEARGNEAEQLGFPRRTWPCRLTAYPHWGDDYARAAKEANVTLTLDEAVALSNEWIKEIAEAEQSQ